jgi:acyl carrier protein
MNPILAEIYAALKDAGDLPESEKLDPAKPLAEQGVDSLELFNAFLAVEEKTGVKIPDERMNSMRSLHDLAQFIGESRENA